MNWRIGETLITRHEESVRTSFPPQVLFPTFDPQALEMHRHWLVPDHFDPGEGKFRTSVHRFLVRTPRHAVLIDTCGGNHKNRPYLPRFHQQEAPWLSRLKSAGVTPEQVDFVMCTHLHCDHIGWNTQLRDGRWVLIFPNAKCLFHRKEMNRWNLRDMNLLWVGNMHAL